MNKKIFFVTVALKGGGAERVMTNIANYLAKRDYDITFLLLNSPEVVYSLDKRVKVIVKDNIKEGDPIGQIKFLRKYMKQNKDALFVSFFTYQNMYTVAAALGLKVNVLVSERNLPSASCQGKAKNAVRKFLYSSNACKRLVFQTKGASEFFDENIRKKSTIIPNPLKDGLPERFEGERRKSVVSFGRYQPQKNYALLVKAFAEFSKVHPDWDMQLYGKGEQKEKLQQLAESLNVKDKITFNDFCTDVHERIVDGGMYVIPSNYEGLSNSMIEALAIGLPVISTDHPPGGAREYITDYKNGILTPVKDVAKMAEAMCYMAEHPKEADAMGKEASKIKDELSSENICIRWQKEFDLLLGK